MGLDHGFMANDNDIIVLRKANHIHKWMCDHTDWDDDRDNGDKLEIPVERIKTLMAFMKAVLLDPDMASTYMPRSSGFFFGSLEYDQWYFDDIKKTLEALEQYLDENPDAETITYWAWW